MKIIDPEVMNTPRSPLCEACGTYCRRPTERHHIVSRGMGGANRLDIPENLIDLGGPFDCNCHGKAQSGHIKKAKLFRIVARRMGTLAWMIRQKVYRLLRAPK